MIPPAFLVSMLATVLKLLLELVTILKKRLPFIAILGAAGLVVGGAPVLYRISLEE